MADILITLSQFIGLYKLRKKAFLTKKKYKKCIFAKETYLGHPKKGGFFYMKRGILSKNAI